MIHIYPKREMFAVVDVNLKTTEEVEEFIRQLLVIRDLLKSSPSSK